MLMPCQNAVGIDSAKKNGLFTSVRCVQLYRLLLQRISSNTEDGRLTDHAGAGRRAGNTEQHRCTFEEVSVPAELC